MPSHVVRTYRYALRPSASQARAMAGVLEAQRLLYNAAHQRRNWGDWASTSSTGQAWSP